jgi:hypothetical protein
MRAAANLAHRDGVAHATHQGTSWNTAAPNNPAASGMARTLTAAFSVFTKQELGGMTLKPALAGEVAGAALAGVRLDDAAPGPETELALV